MGFQELERRYFELKRRQHEAGSLDIQELYAQLGMAQDAEGRWWTIDLHTGEWLYHDDENDAWVESTPPGLPEEWYNRGESLADAGRYQEAIEAFDRALSLKPGFPEAWHKKGWSLRVLGSRGEQEAYERRLRSMTIDYYLPSYSDDDFSYNAARRYEEAVMGAFDRALILKPAFPQAWYSKGDLMADLRRYEEAIEAYDRVTSLRSGSRAAWDKKGELLRKLGRDEEAEEAQANAEILNSPNDASGWHRKGRALILLGRYEEAVEAYDRVLSLKPDDPIAWYRKGESLGKLGHRQEAIAWLCRAWRAREQLREARRNMIANLLTDLGHDPKECEAGGARGS